MSPLGPFCSVLVERFGCRATVMLGGVLSGLGMVASSFTHTITELYVTAGIITGHCAPTYTHGVTPHQWRSETFKMREDDYFFYEHVLLQHIG